MAEQRLVKISSVCYMLFAFCFEAGYAYWTKSEGPSGSTCVYGFCISRSNPQVLYIADWEAGCFKSINGGASWFPLRNGLTDWRAQAIAVDPIDENMAYINTFWAGLYRSTDGGNSWELCLPRGSGCAVTVDPTYANVVYAGMGNRVYKTTDRGASWDSLSISGTAGSIYSIAVSAVDPRTIYTASGWNGGSPSGIYKSIDGGATWTQLTNGLPAYGAGDVEVNPQNEAILFAAFLDGIYRSTDSGGSWSLVLAVPDNRFKCVAIDPESSLIIYASTSTIGLPNANLNTGLYKSTDGGNTWFEANNGLLDKNFNAIVIDPVNPAIVYLASYNINQGGAVGVCKSTNRGASWFAANQGITLSIWDIAIPSNNPQTIWVTSYGGGAYKSIDDGAHWQAANTGISDQRILDIAVDPQEPNRMYAATIEYQASGGIFRSTNGGADWIHCYSSNACSRITVDPSHPNRIWAGGEYPGTILKSTDYGVTWTQVFNTGSGEMIRSICVDPQNSQIVYVGCYWYLYKTTNSGNSWIQITPPFGEAHGESNSIIVDPDNHNTIYVGVTHLTPTPSISGVWKSTDAGSTWSQLCNIQKVGPMVNIPWDHQVFYAGSYAEGVWVTTDRGLNWNPVNEGLEQTSQSVISLGLRETAAPYGTLYAGLYIDGLFSSSIQVGVNEDHCGLRAAGLDFSLAPNPSNDKTKLSFVARAAGNVEVSIHDVTGRSVGCLLKAHRKAGVCAVDINTGDLVAGTYFISVTTGERTVTKVMSVIK